MEFLLNFISSKTVLAEDELKLVKKSFVALEVDANTVLLKQGQIANHIYFLSKGIVKGYENNDGKNVICQLIPKENFFTSLESFFHQKPSTEFLQTITDCKIAVINKQDLDYLIEKIPSFSVLVQEVTNLHLSCKIERVKDFQTLSAKQRYKKFMVQYPKLALEVSIDNIASYLGMEPQSLSRIRRQLTF